MKVTPEIGYCSPAISVSFYKKHESRAFNRLCFGPYFLENNSRIEYTTIRTDGLRFVKEIAEKYGLHFMDVALYAMK